MHVRKIGWRAEQSQDDMERDGALDFACALGGVKIPQ